eukprot:scaffold1899_cov112-Cylindrotheca_fusiformis.AAC.1
MENFKSSLSVQGSSSSHGDSSFPYFLRDQVSLPTFVRAPPSSVLHPWPGSCDFQWYGHAATLSLEDVWVLVEASGFIEQEQLSALVAYCPVLRLWSRCGPFWITRPWPPIRKRRWGFGRMSAHRSCAHDTPNFRMAPHFVWCFLSSFERVQLLRAHPFWFLYAALRKRAVLHSLAPLRLPRSKDHPHPAVSEGLSMSRAVLHSAALLRFDFDYGDFIRWMGGEYTNQYRDWTREWEIILNTPCRRLPAGYPPPDYVAAFRLQTEGAPLKGQYVSPVSVLSLRDEYDNHPAVSLNTDAVRSKFAKEEWNSYHVHFLRFVYVFMYGIILNPIQWVFQKGKGRICIDCTNGPGDAAGSANSHIPKPSPDVALECPPVYYQTAFQRLLRRILQMRMSCPDVPITVHADDIASAFRRVLYHPDMACAFAYVFEEFLLVPVGEVFGSRSAPSFYCVMADVRQALAAILKPVPPAEYSPLVRRCHIEVSDPQLVPFASVPADDLYTADLSLDELNAPFNSSFVDDNGVVAFQDNMLTALDQSVRSAFLVFGAAGSDRRGDCFQQEKWEDLISEEFLYLGFLINTRRMTITWPEYKREQLHAELLSILRRSPHRRFVTPKEMAHIIGVVRSASEVAPWGNFLSFNLDNALTAAAAKARQAKKKTGSKWWRSQRIFLSKVAVATIRQLLETLLGEQNQSLWIRPIALYLERRVTHSVLSDASYLGLGGWSPDFLFLWRLTRSDLVAHGFHMKSISTASGEPSSAHAAGLHINPLEFVATIINLWVALKIIQQRGPIPGGYILGLLSDNTTALSWMSFTSRTPDPLLQGLARLGSALLVRATALLTKVLPSHIAGQLNVEADTLSRPWTNRSPSSQSSASQIPSLASVISKCSRLQTCRVCLLPSELLHKIASLTSSPLIGDTYERITT